MANARRRLRQGGRDAAGCARRADLRPDDRPERHVQHHECVAAVGAARHQSRRCGRRHPRPSDRRHGFDRHGEQPGSDHPGRGRRSSRQSFLYRVGRTRCDGQNIADPAQGRRHVRRLHCQLPQSGACRLREAARGAWRHFARAPAWACHHGGGSKRRARGDRSDLPHDLRKNPRRRQSHAQGRDLHRRRVRHRHHHRSLRDARSRAPRHERIHGGGRRQLTSGDISRCDHDLG